MDALTWLGRVRVVATHEDGSTTVEEFRNLLTHDGLDLLRDALADGTSPRIEYLALGDNSTLPSTADSALYNERERFQVTSRTKSGTGELVTTVYVGPADATGYTIEELGWFAGTDASGASGSGVLLARVLYSRNKTNLESLQIDRTDTLARA